jgi:hypothetical protein
MFREHGLTIPILDNLLSGHTKKPDKEHFACHTSAFLNNYM